YMGGFLSFSNTNAQTTLENCLFAGKFERGENLTDQAFLGAVGTLRSVKAINNCYYLGDGVLEAVHSNSDLKPGSDNVEIISVTGAQLLSGEVAYLLGEAWGQTIGTDEYPVFATADNIVYESVLCDDSIGYSNFQSEEVSHKDLNDHGYCSICQIKITGASITVGKDLTMNYYVSLIDPTLLGEGQSLTMRFTMGGKTFTATEYTPENGEYIFAFTGIAPQQMSDNILAELLIGEDVIASKDHYSVKANAEALLELYKDDEYLVQFVTDMLCYGAAAQNYKDYNVEDLANADVADLGTPSAALPEKTDLDLAESASQSLYFVSATVWFDNVNKIGVRLSTLENASLKVNGVEVELTDVLYYTEGISATDFDKIYTFELYENGELVQTLKYSVNSYAYSKQSSENQTMRDLAISLYRYGASAEIYRHIASNEAHVFENGVCSICGIATYTYDESTNTYGAYTEEGLQEAVAGAMATGTVESPATIIVMADMEVNDPDPSNDEMYGNNGITLTAGVVILDLNGHTLTSTDEDASISVRDGARLTIRDSSASQSGKMINSNDILSVSNSAELIVDGGIFESQGGDTVYLVNWGSLTVNGGTFTSLKMSAVYTCEKITINGGSFVGAEYAVRVGASGAKVTLNGGSFTGETADIRVYNSTSAVMSYAEDGNGAYFADGLSIKCWSGETATLGEILADGAGYFDADGNLITTGLDGMSIEGDVTVKKIN
ncbi:MAG: hypothetical protein IJY22_04460, partial [Clostridia bacterium]|nr:hypothetical protein [Clostridia bacterium]